MITYFLLAVLARTSATVVGTTSNHKMYEYY